MTARTMNAKADSDGLTVQIEGKTVCPANRFQQMVSGKYKLRILWGLKGGWKRYAEIKRGLLTGSIGTAEIAPRVLSRELRTLVTMGMRNLCSADVRGYRTANCLVAPERIRSEKMGGAAIRGCWRIHAALMTAKE